MMRPNRIGWSLVAFFFVVGAVITAIDPTIWLGEAYMGGAVVLAGVYLLMTKRADRSDRLIREGIPAEAEILELDQTGMYLNEQPRIRLKLQIEAPGVAPFESEDTYTVPLAAVGALSGGRLPVFLDRKNPSRFTIDWLGGRDSEPDSSPRDRLAQLNELKDSGLITDGEFQQQRARILGSL
jgi:hypothetical protein